MAITYSGSKNFGADKTELFQKIFKGEVEEAWLNTPVTNGLLTKKTIQNGKSYEFKNSGVTEWIQAWDGTETVPSGVMEFSNTIVVLEPRVKASEMITEDQSKMNDFNERQVIKDALISTLINKYDYDRIREVFIGSTSSNVIPTLPGGSQITNADFASADYTVKGEALFDACFKIKQIFSEKNVNETPYLLVDPAGYNALSRLEKAINKDLVIGNNGGLNKGNVLEVAGVTILVSNNLKKLDTTADTYHGCDMTFCDGGVAFTMSAVATVESIGMDTRFVKKDEFFAEQIISSYFSGHKWLRPECSISLISQ